MKGRTFNFLNIAPVLLGILLSAGVFAQAVTETTKIDEFGAINCCDFGARMDNAAIQQRANPGSQIHLIFYNARGYNSTRWNKKLREREPVLLNPIRGEFSGFVRGVKQRADFQKLDMKTFVITNGGYREKLIVEVWIVPAGAEPPKVTPTVDKKRIKLQKGTLHFLHVCDDI
jgi:hypothetical protein